MYSRMLRNVLNTSAKLSKQKINKSAKLIFPTSLTVPKLLACTSQYSVQNYSSSKESSGKTWSKNEDLNEQSTNQEYDSDEQPEDDNFKCDPRNPSQYFNKIDQEKLEALLKDNPEKQQLKKIIELELTVMGQDGECVPSQLTDGEWVELLTMKTRNQRKKYFKYLFINEKITEKVKKKKAERQIELAQVREERKNQVPTDEIKYGFNHNFMLRRISNTYINTHQQWNSLKAIMFGNKLVFDCSYDQYMSVIESRSCAKQIMESYALNRIHNFPFEIFLTNVDYSSLMFRSLYKFIPTLFEKDFPITVTGKSYLELFDRSKLCYLSSNAPTVLTEYDCDTIYIIGAFVDKGAKQPISFGKAKKEGIRMAKLPLDHHLKFGTGGARDLTLNQVCNIMLDAQCHSWKEAFKHVPTRKLYESSIRNLENRIQRHNMIEDARVNETYDSTTAERHKNRNFNFSTEETHETHANRRFDSNNNTQNSAKSIFSSDARESKRFDSNSNIQNSAKSIFSSDAVTDFSHSARAKLREKWNK